jgi:hypothetical protein
MNKGSSKLFILISDTCVHGCETNIGGTDILLEGKFMWYPSNLSMVFTNWSPGEPSGGGEDCVVMWTDGTWIDGRCTGYRAKFICEKRKC